MCFPSRRWTVFIDCPAQPATDEINSSNRGMEMAGIVGISFLLFRFLVFFTLSLSMNLSLYLSLRFCIELKWAPPRIAPRDGVGLSGETNYLSLCSLLPAAVDCTVVSLATRCSLPCFPVLNFSGMTWLTPSPSVPLTAHCSFETHYLTLEQV